MKYILLLFLAVFTLSSCVTKTTNNYMPPDLPDNSMGTIATDIASIIAEHNPAKSTIFMLHQDEFSRNLGEDLGKLGYEIIFSGQTEHPPEYAEEIRYTIDWTGPDFLYIALTVNNRQRYTRSYTVDADTLLADKTKLIGVSDD